MFKALQIATTGAGGAGVVFQADGDPRTDVSAALAASGGAGIANADGMLAAARMAIRLAAPVSAGLGDAGRASVARSQRASSC